MPKNCNLCWGPEKVSFRPYVANPEDNDDLQNVPIQLSVHSVSAVSYLRELTAVFPNLKNIKEATIICSMQNASKDLAGVGFAIEGEKDVLLERFTAVARTICSKLQEREYYADFIDPCSGLPAICLDGNTVFNEVQSAQVLLGYQIMNVGCCKVILHPEWGASVYPASIITLAPVEEVIRCIQDYI